MMTREQFIHDVTEMVHTYEANLDTLRADPQLRINPMNMTLSVVTVADMQNELAYTDEDSEANAAAEGDMTESSDDYEAAQNPDFIPLRTLQTDEAIAALANNYF